MPKTKQQSSPTFLANAQTFYGDAFDHKTKKAIARSMTEWAELDEDEQSFAHCHLLFLNLQAQAATQRLLVQVRDLLDEVAESLTVALEASLPEEGQAEEVGEGEGEEGDDDEDPDLPGDDEDPAPPRLAEAMREEADGDEDDDDQADDDQAGDDEGGEQ